MKEKNSLVDKLNLRINKQNDEIKRLNEKLNVK